MAMTPDELRDAYTARLKREKQKYIAEATGISTSTLSKFRNRKFDLYPHLAEKLEDYLLNS
ncbi:MAG: hypothetical protein LUD12_12305 [Lachnospiraceae bacterium]|nr:hypothetical protein [Lachnospiraceae bacterium]